MAAPVAFQKHDHRACISRSVKAVEQLCRAQGLQLTALRRRVLEILLEAHRALGAYDVLERLRENGGAAQPPTAYRALEFLTENGFAHRIERLNAFVACMHPDQHHDPAFLICRGCNAVAETPAPASGRGALGISARATGFAIERRVLEALGLCPNCRDKDTSCR